MAKYRTNWDLTCLYKSDKDPQIEKDMKAVEKAFGVFEKKYKKSDYTASAKKLAVAIKDYETLFDIFLSYKPWWYFALQNRLDSNNETVNAMLVKFEQRMTESRNKISFFELNIAKISKDKQKIFLKDNALLKYKYFLTLIFETAKYNLSESEEQLASLLSQTSYSMWVDSQQKLLGQQTIKYNGKNISIPEASSLVLSSAKKEDRRELQNKLNEKMKTISHFAEAELNSIYNYKKIMDEKRGYKKPYTSTSLSFETDDKTTETVVNLVTKNFSISKRFYKLHAKLLGDKKITYADRAANLGEVKKKFDFNTAVSIVRDTFNKIDKRYGVMFDEFITNGRIDVYPKVGKSGGAFCWGTPNLPTFVLLNHTDDLSSVETLGHEMGHAMHSELSESQPVFYKKYPILTAEVASTFFEQVVSSELEKYLSVDEKIIFLHSKIQGDVQTIFRQIACFNFELELHILIRKNGQVSKDQIAELLSKHMRSYLGDSVVVTKDDGYFFVQWGHIRRFFYVSSYAYGQIVSKALFENWKKDNSYSDKIYQFLSAGRSMSPKDIFKSIGINTADPKFFADGLKSIENDIKKLEKLVSK